jgi:perosamine synthetase
MYKEIFEFIHSIYPTKQDVALHEPVLNEVDKKFVDDCIDSGFVSSVGKYVNQFEQEIAKFCGVKFAVATVNGTAALHIALKLSGAGPNTEVLTQALTFIASANAISYCGASPVFLDSERETLGLSPEDLKNFFQKNTEKRDGKCFNKKTQKQIVACVPMHVFGHPVKIDQIIQICSENGVKVVEDAAESLGSYSRGRHTGSIAQLGILSFNGNKIITTGGGGMILTNDESLAKKAKHLTTTAKKPHAWEFDHDEIGYNYRLPNLNAALGCAQMSRLSDFVENKRKLAEKYRSFFTGKNIPFLTEPEACKSNYWLNAIFLNSAKERDSFLAEAQEAKIMARPAWKLMPELVIYKNAETTNLDLAKAVASTLVNIPSSVTT